jgi:hypothetical protein
MATPQLPFEIIVMIARAVEDYQTKPARQIVILDMMCVCKSWAVELKSTLYERPDFTSSEIPDAPWPGGPQEWSFDLFVRKILRQPSLANHVIDIAFPELTTGPHWRDLSNIHDD